MAMATATAARALCITPRCVDLTGGGVATERGATPADVTSLAVEAESSSRLTTGATQHRSAARIMHTKRPNGARMATRETIVMAMGGDLDQYTGCAGGGDGGGGDGGGGDGGGGEGGGGDGGGGEGGGGDGGGGEGGGGDGGGGEGGGGEGGGGEGGGGEVGGSGAIPAVFPMGCM